MTYRDHDTPSKRPQPRIVVTDAPIGLLAGMGVLVAVAFVAISASEQTGLADAPMRIEALPIPDSN